jgi:hypothetical protein
VELEQADRWLGKRRRTRRVWQAGARCVNNIIRIPYVVIHRSGVLNDGIFACGSCSRVVSTMLANSETLDLKRATPLS